MLLAMFMLSEAVLSVERTGLPYLTIMIDDSASQRIADQYEKPEVKAALDKLAAVAEPESNGAAATAETSKADDPARHRQGLDPEGQGQAIQELEKQHKVRLYLVSTRPGCWPRSIGPATSTRRSRAAGDRAVGSTIAAGRRRPPGPDRAPRRTALGDRAPHRRPDHRGRAAGQGAELAAKKGVPLFAVGLGSAEPARDIELTELLVDDVVFVDDAVRFQAKLLGPGLRGRKGRRPAQGARARLARPQGARELESIEVEAPADGQPKRVELVHHPKTTGERTFILEVDKNPASSRPRTTGSSAWSPSARRSSRSSWSTASRATSSAI